MMLGFFLIFGCLIGFSMGSDQSMDIAGHIVCGDKELPFLEIRLFDVNSLVPDTLMGVTTTNKTGYFEVLGSASSLIWIKPELRIYHKCNEVKKEECSGIRMDQFEGWRKYVTDGSEIPKVKYTFQSNIHLNDRKSSPLAITECDSDTEGILPSLLGSIKIE